MPPVILTPLSFPSQNQRYTVDRDTDRRWATSLGLIRRSWIISRASLFWQNCSNPIQDSCYLQDTCLLLSHIPPLACRKELLPPLAARIRRRERSTRLRAASVSPAPFTGIFLAPGSAANLWLLSLTREGQRRMNKSAGPADDVPAREDKGPKVRGNRSRGIWPSLGVMPQSPLNLGGLSGSVGKTLWQNQTAGRMITVPRHKNFSRQPPINHRPTRIAGKMPILMVPGTHSPLGLSGSWSPGCGRLTSFYFPTNT